MHFGTAKLPLRELLRQGSSAVQRTKECDVVRFDFTAGSPMEQRKRVGALQILYTNTAKNVGSLEDGQASMIIRSGDTLSEDILNEEGRLQPT